jgi:superfamily II DNA or RNA helicase
MKIDQKKLARQKQCFDNWLAITKIGLLVKILGIERLIRAGIIEAATGFGKTFIAIKAIRRMNIKHPDWTTYVVVPKINLKEDWERKEQVFNEKGELVLDYGHIIKHDLKNVKVFVVNSYVKFQDYECDFLVLDEAHHYAGKDAEQFNKVTAITKFRYGMALSATLSKEQKEFFYQMGWQIADIVTPEECEVEGYTSTSITYNLAIPLSRQDEQFNEEINEKFKSMFKKFDNEFELMKACQVGASVSVSVRLRDGKDLGKKTGKEWREWFAKKKGWDEVDMTHIWSPPNLQKYAVFGMTAMRKRKSVWQNMPSKLFYVEELIRKFGHLKMIIFSETSDFADKIAAKFPNSCLSYHTNLATLAIKGDEVVEVEGREQLKKFRQEGYTIKGKAIRKREAIQLFVDSHSGINQISAVKALDEGTDVPKIEVGVQTAYSSKERQDTQRTGRTKRIDYDNLSKKALNVNLYMKGTQEEKWLRAKQTGRRNIRWVESVDEIHINQTVSLYAPTDEEVPAVEAGDSGGDIGVRSNPDNAGS